MNLNNLKIKKIKRPAPETDAESFWPHYSKYKVCDVEFARKLERERDEAREKLDEEMKWHHRTHKELIEAQCKLLDMQMGRDEAQEKYDNLATEHMLVVNKLCEERDEAQNASEAFSALAWKLEGERNELLNEIKRLRLDAQREAEHPDRMIGELEKVYTERDDAMEKVKELIYIADRAIALADIDFENDKFGVVSELRGDLEKIKKSK
jgi:uncharacterized protein (DUF3084 family)